MSVTRFLAGFAIGAAIGAVAGILLAPKSGAETREMLGDMASDMAKKTDETVKDIHDRMPLILNHDQVRPWLTDAQSALGLLTIVPPALQRSSEDGQLSFGDLM